MKTPFRFALPWLCTAVAAFGLETERTASEIVKMQEAGLEKTVIIAYVQNARVPFNATAQDVLFLHEHKVPDDVIREWINKSGALGTPAAAAQAQAPVLATPTPVPAPAPAPARSPDLVAASLPPAQPVVVQQPVIQQQPIVYQAAPTVIAAPAVTYAYPSYSYVDYSYWPAPISVGFSYGWGRGGWGHYGGHGPWRGGWGGPGISISGHFGGGHRR